MALIDLKSASLKSDGLAIAAVAIANDADNDARHDAVERAGDSPIAIPFPKFNDGRGFSLANVLRRQHQFTGELRATGHIIPDQAIHLLRAGFDTVEVDDAAVLPAWQAALNRYRGNYQTALRNPAELRRDASRNTSDDPVASNSKQTISQREADSQILASSAT